MSKAEVPARLAGFYAATDTLDVAKYRSAFVDDAIVTFGNLPSVTGRDAIAANFEQMAANMLAGIEHLFENVIQSGELVMLEASVTYRLKDGREICLPCVSVVELRGDLIARLSMYLDPTPLFVSEQIGAAA